MVASVGEPFLPYRAERARTEAKNVRSTLIASSVQALKRRGIYDAYLEKLPAPLHETIASCIAGGWLPMATAIQHYEAVDAIGLTDAQVNEMGVDVSTQTQATYLATAVKLATSAGATPWTALAQFQRLWDRINDGGDCTVFKLGPKDAHLEYRGLPLVRVRYYRLAFRHYTQTLFRLFSSSCYVNDVPRSAGPASGAFRVAWV
jgi:hypothetical protein